MDEKKNINESWRATWTVPFTITPDYYESLSNKVPVNFVPNAVPQYSYEQKAVYMPHAMGYISQEANKLGQENTEEYLRKNNLIQSDIDPANVLRNLEQEYKGRHRARGHALCVAWRNGRASIQHETSWIHGKPRTSGSWTFTNTTRALPNDGQQTWPARFH